MVTASRNKLELTLPSDREIRFTRAFDAPRRLVFDAWTRPEHVRQWWGCLEGFSVPVCEIDLRVGGEWHYVNRGPGGVDYPFRGTYREVVPPARLVYTEVYDVEPFSQHEALVTVTFDERDGQTVVTETVLHASKEARDGHLQSGMETGAAESLDRLELVAARLDAAQRVPDVVITRTFDAPRDMVWQAWSDPVHVAKWWGPHMFTTGVEHLDFREGGTFDYLMKGPGGFARHVTGTFEEIVAPDRLVMASRLTDPKDGILLEVQNIVTLEERARRTMLTFRARVRLLDAKMAAAVGGMEEGWSQSFDRLASAVATRASEREMVITRVVDAPRHLVWTAWTDPAHVSRWWGPDGFTTTTHEFDLRPGGTWRHTMHGPDGTNHPNLTVFHQVDAPERLVYSNSGREENGPQGHFTSIVLFLAEGRRTRIVLRATFDTPAARQFVMDEFGAYEGGHQTLQRLADYLADLG